LGTGGSVQRRKRQAPATAATHCHPKGLSGPSSGGAVPTRIGTPGPAKYLVVGTARWERMRPMGSRREESMKTTRGQLRKKKKKKARTRLTLHAPGLKRGHGEN
jgi:hypothetical protein